MSNAIANLLDKPEHLVENMVKNLEDLNGQPSEDVRLLAENLQKLRIKLKQLGLDPSDTTSQELYHCLRAKFVKASDQLDKALGINKDDGVGLRAAKAAQLVAALGTLPEMWLLKHSTAKTILRQIPPKKLMKKLNYQSVQSLLKRESLDNIFLAATLVESEAWQAAVAKKISKLSSANFEMRDLHVASLPLGYYKTAAGSKSLAIVNLQIGAVAIWQPNLPSDASALSIAALTISTLEKLSGVNLSERFYTLSPALRWWSDNSSLISVQNSEPVSLNLKDIAHDSLRNHDYLQRTKRHGAKALLSSLLSRYHNQSDKVNKTIKAIGYDLSPDSSANFKLPLGAQLAAEYALAD